MFTPHCTITGDVSAVQVMVSQGFWERTLSRVFQNAGKAAGEAYIQRVKENILAQKIGGPPLSDFWQSRKGHANKWLWTRQTLESLSVWKEDGQWVAGIPPDVIHEKSGLPLELIGSWVEDGTSRMLARPVFGPTADEMRNEKQFQMYLRESLLKDTFLGKWLK